MELFLDKIDEGIKNKKKEDKNKENYIEDIHQNLLIPILSHYDMCDELINFNDIFSYPYNKNQYISVFTKIKDKII